MAYRFNGSTNYVEFAVAPLVGILTDALTIAILLKRGGTGANMAQGPSVMDSGLSTSKIYERFGSADQLQMNPGVTSGPTLTSTSLWYLIVATFPASSTPVTHRWHVNNGSSWSHTAQTGALWSGAASALVSGDRLFIGKLGTALLPFNGDIVCAGIKKADSTDLQVEALNQLAFSAWRSFGFDWLVGFDTSLQSAGVLQDQASPGTGDQVAISGTSVVADPPGWSWVSAVTPSANFTGTPLTGTEPLSVAFTDSSTNTPTSWAWTFGDGGTSTSQNPTHSYATAGTFTVALTATNAAGSNTLTRTGYVVVSDQPRPVRINTSQGWVDIADATSFVSGSGAPTAAQGATGAIYLNTASGLLYGPKAAGAWPGTALPVPAGAPPADATTSVKGIVQLAGDLAGSAASPQIATGVIVDADVAAANKDGTAATPSLRTLGTGATQAAAGNDSRLLKAAVAYGTSLPASPVDGQEAILVDSATAPTYQWRFRWNAGSSWAYKWELVGGAPISQYEAVNQLITVASGKTAIGPSPVLPRAGVYQLRLSTIIFSAFAGASMRLQFTTYPGLVNLGDQYDNGITAANIGIAAVAEQTATLTSAGAVVCCMTALSNEVSTGLRTLTVIPIRVS